MMDLSYYEWKFRQEWGEVAGVPAPERKRGWSNLYKGNLRNRIRDCEDQLDRDRAGLASTTTSFDGGRAMIGGRRTTLRARTAKGIEL